MEHFLKYEGKKIIYWMKKLKITQNVLNSKLSKPKIFTSFKKYWFTDLPDRVRVVLKAWANAFLLMLGANSLLQYVLNVENAYILEFLDYPIKSWKCAKKSEKYFRQL